MNHKRYQSGFTIVELLIVIVVIGILAAVTVVAYTGIQQRTRVSVAESDLKTLGTAMQLYQAENGRYPTTNPELLEALSRNSQILQLGVTNTGTFSSDTPKSFVYCYGDDGSSLWIAAWKPVVEDGGSASVSNGTPIYYWSNGSVKETGYVYNGSQAGSSLCEVASNYTHTTHIWSYRL